MLLNIFVNIFNWLFKEYPPLKYSFGNESYSLMIDGIGGYFLAISFTIIGLVFVWFAGNDKKSPLLKQRRFLTQLIGLSIFFDGVARFLTEISVYHNYLHIHVLIKIIAGILGIISLVYTPMLLRKLKETKTIEEVSKSIEETKIRLQQIHELNKRLDGDDS